MRTIFAIAVVFALLLTGCPAGDDGSKSDKTNETDPTDTVDDPIVDPNTGEVIFLHMVHVQKGSFMMGQNGDGTIGGNASNMREVTLTKDFYIGKYEVTQAQWEAVMGSLPDGFPEENGKGHDYPMYYTNWYDAIVFCNKLSMMEGLTPAFKIDGKTDPDEWGEVPTATTHASYATYKDVEIVADSTGYRLPSEAQWEYAAKGGHLASDPYYIFPGSNRINLVAWNNNNNGTSGTELYGAKRVGTKQANELGIHDMAGNVAEWCLDNYNTSYAVTEDPLNWAADGNSKNTRGGYWRDSFQVGPIGGTFANLRGGDFRYGLRVVRPAE
jgi:formylglycine-generating enzyme required for sulfatase activity